MSSKCVIALTLSSARDDRCTEIADLLSKKFFHIQSEDVPDSGASATSSEVLTFVDNSADVNDVGYTRNPIASLSATSNTSLGKFLSRPTIIDSRTWSTSDLPGYSGVNIEPWALFLNNAVIKNKLSNYAFLRAKLCLKIIINATPFHFGCMRVAYEPNVNVAGTGFNKTKIITSSALDVIPISQLPGVWLYPADNAGGDLHLPFFKVNNWLALNRLADAKSMGMLRYYIYAPLGVASSSGSPTLTIDTFAWLEEVELSGSTAELVLQSGDKYDGPVSSVASAIASMSSNFEELPVIGKFARATSIGAGAVAGIASLFGFTNTPVIKDVPARIPMPGPHIASSEIGAPVQKLTLDPKQELSIDPTLHGLDSTDEMSIRYIASKKSLLSNAISWSTADIVGKVLFNANVSPMLFGANYLLDVSSVLQSTQVYHTPMSYLGMMFTHWRGDIVFDFEVVCTKFHKGRLKITWDPLGTSGATALPENVVFTTILDIGENNKASLRVPFHQAYAWLRTRGISRLNYTTGAALPVNEAYDNGLLSVTVLTPLMSPVSPQDLKFLVSVSAADNFELCNPASHLGESTSSPPPSFFTVQSADKVDTTVSTVDFGDTGAKHPHRYSLNFGEQVVSLRTLLHRMSIYDNSQGFGSSATKFVIFTKSLSRLPPSFGYDPIGLSSAFKIRIPGTNSPFNYTPTHPITYVAAMYGGFRGGINYTANVGTDLTPYVGDVRVNRITDNTYPAYRRGGVFSTLNSSATSSLSTRFVNMSNELNPGCAGAAFTNTQTNGAVSWNMPQMSGVNFNFADPSAAMAGNTYDQTDLECSTLSINLKQQTADTSARALTVTTYAGTGVDFTCLWWLCCPVVEYYSSIPGTT